jgi:hypothetical protein
MMASVRNRFADLDLNKDGGLDRAELDAGNISRDLERLRAQLRDADIDL